MKNNEIIGEITTLRQLATVNLDLDSPRLMQAMERLGYVRSDLEKKDKKNFSKWDVDHDVTDIRYEHYQKRLMESINCVILERQRIKDAANHMPAKLAMRNSSLQL